MIRFASKRFGHAVTSVTSTIFSKTTKRRIAEYTVRSPPTSTEFILALAELQGLFLQNVLISLFTRMYQVLNALEVPDTDAQGEPPA